MSGRVGSLCSGYGGLDLAVEQFFGATTAWFCEYDHAPDRILAHHWPDVPNHGDVLNTDWLKVEPIDILTAGYPCQPFSHAGKRQGADDPRHLWPGVARAISDLRPGIVVLENVRGHVSLGLDAVLGDLAALGYDARWGVVRAADAGAAHGRARVFIVATDASGAEWGATQSDGVGAAPGSAAELGERAGVDWGIYTAAIHRWTGVIGRPAPAPTDVGKNGKPRLSPLCVEWLMGLPEGHVTDPAIGLTRNQQLMALGNGVVPQQAVLALGLLTRQAAAA